MTPHGLCTPHWEGNQEMVKSVESWTAKNGFKFQLCQECAGNWRKNIVRDVLLEPMQIAKV